MSSRLSPAFVLCWSALGALSSSCCKMTLPWQLSLCAVRLSPSLSPATTFAKCGNTSRRTRSSPARTCPSTRRFSSTCRPSRPLAWWKPLSSGTKTARKRRCASSWTGTNSSSGAALPPPWWDRPSATPVTASPFTACGAGTSPTAP